MRRSAELWAVQVVRRQHEAENPVVVPTKAPRPPSAGQLARAAGNKNGKAKKRKVDDEDEFNPVCNSNCEDKEFKHKCDFCQAVALGLA